MVVCCRTLMGIIKGCITRVDDAKTIYHNTKIHLRSCNLQKSFHSCQEILTCLSSPTKAVLHPLVINVNEQTVLPCHSTVSIKSSYFVRVSCLLAMFENFKINLHVENGLVMVE